MKEGRKVEKKVELKQGRKKKENEQTTQGQGKLTRNEDGKGGKEESNINYSEIVVEIYPI